MPVNGSRMTASTIASARWAVRGLASTHHARSSRNSGWKTETRRRLREAKLRPQLGDGLCLPLPGERAAQRGEEALRVPGRAHQVRGLHEALQFARRHERHGFVPAAIDDDHVRSEEHTSELQSPCNLVCRLLLEKKKKNKKHT